MAVKKRYIETPIERPYVILLASLFIMMLAFFALLIATGVPSPERQRLAWGSLLGTFGNVPGGERGSPDPGLFSGNRQHLTNAQMDELSMALADLMRSQNLRGDVDVFLRGDAMVIRLQAEGLFAPNSDELLPGAEAVLSEVVHTANRSERLVTIEGHTDSRTALPPAYESRWTFAAARAQRVHDFALSQSVSPQRLRVASMGSQRPFMPNETEYQRAQNRRIEIVIDGGAADPLIQPPRRSVEIGGIEVELVQTPAASSGEAAQASRESVAEAS